MSTELLYHCWYVAAPSGLVKAGAMRAFTLLGQRVLIGREASGKVFALRDFCPHRGVPLSYGCFDGTKIECCYHGWQFNTEGACTHIPALPEGDATDISRIKAFRFPAQELNGAIWVYMPPPGVRLPEVISELPDPQEGLGLEMKHIESVEFPCNVDHAVIGLMDPSHGPFVHQSWWWRTRRSIHEKSKRFVPHKLGFRMASHAPSSNSRAYKLLGGGERTTEITFQLPSLRTEHIRIGTKHIFLLTALTPLDATRTALHQFAASDIGLLNALLPLIRPFGKAFIKQDMDMVKKQQEGLQPGHPALMLLGDADQQALWYFKLKKDFLTAQENKEDFVNRVPEKTLRWRS